LFRGDKSRSQRGLGLGLSLVKAIVEAHKGRVEVSSTVGEGSEFRIYLPMEQMVATSSLGVIEEKQNIPTGVTSVMG